MNLESIHNKHLKDTSGAKAILATVPTVTAELNKLINTKITKKDGSLTAKVEKIIEPILDGIISNNDNYDSIVKNTYKIRWIQVRERFIGSSYLDLNISLCYSEGNNTSCFYNDAGFKLGEIDKDGVLISVNDNISGYETRAKADIREILSILNRHSDIIEQIRTEQKELPCYAHFTLPYGL